jgi:hypothetical protein
MKTKSADYIMGRVKRKWVGAQSHGRSRIGLHHQIGENDEEGSRGLLFWSPLFNCSSPARTSKGRAVSAALALILNRAILQTTHP